MTTGRWVPISPTKAKGNPIFLIHGWTMNHKFFRHNIPRALPHPPRRDVDIPRTRPLRQAGAQHDARPPGRRALIEHLGLDNITIVSCAERP